MVGHSPIPRFDSTFCGETIVSKTAQESGYLFELSGTAVVADSKADQGNIRLAFSLRGKNGEGLVLAEPFDFSQNLCFRTFNVAGDNIDKLRFIVISVQNKAPLKSDISWFFGLPVWAGTQSFFVNLSEELL
jgi:hypothetical protein